MVQVRTSVVPRYSRALPAAGSDALHDRTLESAAPSPLGEKMDPAAWALIEGAVVSTRTENERPARLPATSHVASATVYRPSGTRTPELSVPFQVHVTEPPVPARLRTAAPAAFVTPIVQLAAPDVASATRTLSRTPSPLGDTIEVVAEAAVTVGGTVSTVIAYAAICLAVTGRADGAEYVLPPATPVSWSMYRPSATAAPATRPFQSHVRAPAPSAGTATEPSSDPPVEYTLSVRESIATEL